MKELVYVKSSGDLYAVLDTGDGMYKQYIITGNYCEKACVSMCFVCVEFVPQKHLLSTENIFRISFQRS